jgi:RHS repeat-associated protein
LGSSTLLTDNNGNPYQFFLNLPFGETMTEQKAIGIYTNPYRFNGKELDDERRSPREHLLKKTISEQTGLYYYGARYYNPRISMWLSVDPMVEKYAGITPYNFTMNNPVMLVDQDGRDVDNYTIDENGYITFSKATKDNFDMLYSKRDYENNNLKDGFKVTDKNVLPALTNNSGIPLTIADGVPDAETGYQKYINTTLNASCSFNNDEMVGLFKFVADASSQSEWRLSKLTNRELVLSTLHLPSDSPNDINLGLDTKSIKWMIHYHPRTRPGGEIKSFGEDGNASRFYKGFFVYFPQSSNLYNFHPSNSKNSVNVSKTATHGNLDVFLKYLK